MAEPKYYEVELLLAERVLVQFLVRQIVSSDLLVDLVEDDIDEVLLASQVLLGGHHELPGFFFEIDFVVDGPS